MNNKERIKLLGMAQTLIGSESVEGLTKNAAVLENWMNGIYRPSKEPEKVIEVREGLLDFFFKTKDVQYRARQLDFLRALASDEIIVDFSYMFDRAEGATTAIVNYIVWKAKTFPNSNIVVFHTCGPTLDLIKHNVADLISVRELGSMVTRYDKRFIEIANGSQIRFVSNPTSLIGLSITDLIIDWKEGISYRDLNVLNDTVMPHLRHNNSRRIST